MGLLYPIYPEDDIHENNEHPKKRVRISDVLHTQSVPEPRVMAHRLSRTNSIRRLRRQRPFQGLGYRYMNDPRSQMRSDLVRLPSFASLTSPPPFPPTPPAPLYLNEDNHSDDLITRTEQNRNRLLRFQSPISYLESIRVTRAYRNGDSNLPQPINETALGNFLQSLDVGNETDSTLDENHRRVSRGLTETDNEDDDDDDDDDDDLSALSIPLLRDRGQRDHRYGSSGADDPK